MSEKPSDNRRRISDNLLEEIEKYDGKDFSEKLLKWKNDSDELSEEELEEKFDKAMTRFEEKVSYEGDNSSSSDLTFDDVTEAVELAMQGFSIDPATGEIVERHS